MPVATLPPPERISESLEASRKEGIASQVSFGIIDFYLIPYALLLGASAQQVGWLVAFPNLLSSLSQFFVVDVVKFMGDRRRVLVLGAGLQAAALFPLAALLWLPDGRRVYALIPLVAAYRVLGSIIGPAWGSLVSDYLPANRRGDYFGRRSRSVGMWGMVNVALWAAVLQLLRRWSERLAFSMLFLCAALFRVLSCRYMARMVNLPEHHYPAEEFSWRSFLIRLRRSNFARFLAYVASVTFAAQTAAAYLSVHMIRDLGFSYPVYMAVHMASSLASFLTFHVWGRHADRVGTARVLRLNSFLIPLIPLFWALTESPWVLFLVELFGGFVWAGFNLCTTNFIYDAIPPAKRVRALGYFNLINGAAIFLGASLGGALADRLPPFRGYPLNTIFLLSAALRLAADLLLAKAFREVRAETHEVSSSRLFFSVVGLRPLFKGD